MLQPTVVRYSRRLKRISLERYLISKVIHEPEKITFHDMIALYDNLIWLEEKCLTDIDFQRKFGKSLEDLSSILKEVNLSQGLTPRALIKISSKSRSHLKGFFLPVRNYPDFKKRFSGTFSIRALPTPQEANRRLPPKRVIGTGYRDKGTAKNPAFDGSPSWQEVASRAGQIALAERRIRDAKSLTEVERVFKDIFGSALSG